MLAVNEVGRQLVSVVRVRIKERRGQTLGFERKVYLCPEVVAVAIVGRVSVEGLKRYHFFCVVGIRSNKSLDIFFKFLFNFL